GHRLGDLPVSGTRAIWHCRLQQPLRDRNTVRAGRVMGDAARLRHARDARFAHVALHATPGEPAARTASPCTAHSDTPVAAACADLRGGMRARRGDRKSCGTATGLLADTRS